MSVGSRQTRRTRRTRRSRERLRESASTKRRELTGLANTKLRELASAVRNILATVARISAKGVTWGVVAVVHAWTRGIEWTRSIEWNVLFFGLLFSLMGVVFSVLAGAIVLMFLFFLSGLFLYVVLWRRESE